MNKDMLHQNEKIKQVMSYRKHRYNLEMKMEPKSECVEPMTIGFQHMYEVLGGIKTGHSFNIFVHRKGRIIFLALNL
jgi:hypothetical protein